MGAKLITDLTIQVVADDAYGGEPWAFTVRKPGRVLSCELRDIFTRNDNYTRIISDPELAARLSSLDRDEKSTKAVVERMQIEALAHERHPEFKVQELADRARAIEIAVALSNEPVGFDADGGRPVTWQDFRESYPLAYDELMYRAASALYVHQHGAGVVELKKKS
jgi:hypothetical protein